MNKEYKVLTVAYLLLALALSGIHIAYILKMNSNSTEKYMRVAVPVMYIVGFMAFWIALFSLYKDQTYVIHILYGVVMLVCLPATLFTMSVATIIGGNV